MTGVYFIINIPREGYEKSMENKLKSSKTSIAEKIGTSKTNFQLNPSEPFNVNRSMKDGLDEIVVNIPDVEIQPNETIENIIKPSNEASMEQTLREIIAKMEIKTASWMNADNFYKVSFPIEKGPRCDETIDLLSEHEIGQKNGSSIATIPCVIYNDKTRAENKETESLKELSWNGFVETARARLNVSKIIETVNSDATLTFDFILSLIVASIVACVGLAENNSLFLTASMLISPLMGPILAATFGTAIKFQKLQFRGLKNEIIGVLVSIFVGFVFGISSCLLSNDDQILTQEMLSRCNFHAVIVGIFISLSSGAAQSVAILRNNYGSLAGVAISASLLPPAVNTGLLWSYSCISKISSELGYDHFKTFVVTSSFSTDQATELIILGSISLLVTFTNVLCIYIMGYLFLRLKIEVAPMFSKEERQFWKHDVPITRNYNKTFHADDDQNSESEFFKMRRCQSENLNQIYDGMMRQDVNQTWSPYRQNYKHDAAKMKKLAMLIKNNSGGDNNDGISEKSDSIDGCTSFINDDRVAKFFIKPAIKKDQQKI